MNGGWKKGDTGLAGHRVKPMRSSAADKQLLCNIVLPWAFPIGRRPALKVEGMAGGIVFPAAVIKLMILADY